MITVGVTGGIGSGKSRLCQTWETLGAEVVYADPLAKELMVSDPDLKREISNRFGPKSYFDDGSLNREWLAVEAFEKGRSDELNRLVHPVVNRNVLRRMEEARSSGSILFVEEAALLLLRGRPRGFDYILVITAPVHLRIRRVVDRDGLTSAEVEERISKQQSEDEMIRMADLVLENESDLATFDERAKALFNVLTKKFEDTGH
ncbi:MAG: dephospho-CoA kinase [Bacteroidota bacterium]